MGDNHQYFVALEAEFNNPLNCCDFPFDYIPGSERTDSSDGSELMGTAGTPQLIRNGLLAGLGFINAKVPENFPVGFFDGTRLRKIFVEGLAEYQQMCAKYHVSGNHGGKPWWHFVAPTMTVVPEDQHLHLKNTSKRWDSLAFHLMFEQVQTHTHTHTPLLSQTLKLVRARTLTNHDHTHTHAHTHPRDMGVNITHARAV
jgi:hypothetical protein